MRAVVLLALLATSCSSCAHLPPPIRDFGVCESDQLRPQWQAILGDVEAALASGSTAPLADIARRFTASTVDCAVHVALGRARASLKDAPSDALSKTTVATAERWLANHDGRN
jgi:hypothetical protein